MSADEFLVCARRGCSWVGTKEQRTPERIGPGKSVLVCPRCGFASYYHEKPLFIPLKAELFEAFRSGEKGEEFRPYGTRWNADACRIGRPAVLAYGYGWPRLFGSVSGFRVDHNPRENCPGWSTVYPGKNNIAACIKIAIDPTKPIQLTQPK